MSTAQGTDKMIPLPAPATMTDDDRNQHPRSSASNPRSFGNFVVSKSSISTGVCDDPQSQRFDFPTPVPLPGATDSHGDVLGVGDAEVDQSGKISYLSSKIT